MEFYGEKIVSKKILEIIANKVWVLHAYLMPIISTLKISNPIHVCISRQTLRSGVVGLRVVVATGSPGVGS